MLLNKSYNLAIRCKMLHEKKPNKVDRIKKTKNQRRIPVSMSLATTWAAPHSFAAMAEAPQPLPRSRTVLFRHTPGLSKRYLQTDGTRWYVAAVTHTLKSSQLFIKSWSSRLESACPPGQYMAQYGSSRGQSSGLSRQNLQFGVKSLSLTSGVRLCCPTISVFSEINLLIDSSDRQVSWLNGLTNILT